MEQEWAVYSFDYPLVSIEGTTQGHPRAMVIYTIATIQLTVMITKLMHGQVGNTSKLVVCGSDFSATGTLTSKN